MKSVKRSLITLFVLATLASAGVVFFKYYSYLFAQKIFGRIYQIERVTEPSLILGGSRMKSPEALYSFAVALRTAAGEIFTASSEDRQWAIAREGLCVEAKFYPYPPWNIEKSGTFFNARLLKLKECPEDLKGLPGEETGDAIEPEVDNDPAPEFDPDGPPPIDPNSPQSIKDL